MFLENGTRLAVAYEAGVGVVIPQGTVHFARNLVCTRSEIVVIFDHPEPGVVYAGEALAGFPPTYLRSAFKGGKFPSDITGNQFIDKSCSCKDKKGTPAGKRKEDEKRKERHAKERDD
ncbi:hypothetical protein PLESTB_000431100 [Pleodorina starrii]|uniref:Cupin type-1 domain-containing protein n=1 Tax=Pleodorina starrii TaxID=330485 RepID=A0A9W6BFE0_9CHLO|nr:hypothetical protein PLESTM_001692800 [Pleodorina starrii]GLC50780.1 hypothetical protein PLESTB_000431100 [Pleodorina starrii]GLC74312.1 hypothetical protein PLESTF_001498300 [Pleodorina starrii]